MDFHEKMHSGALYLPMDDSILVEQFQCLDKLYEYNQTRPSQQAERFALLKEMLAEVGEGCYVEAPLHANWGGHHVHFGKYVYCNFNCTFVDDTHIYVGDYTELGPNVVAVGNPCRVLREINEHDREYYFKDRKIDWEQL